MNTLYYLNRIRLAIAFALSFAMFWWVGNWFDIPAHRGFNASLLAQPSAVSTILIVAITALISTALCTIIAGAVRSDAGLFCTALGLMALSVRGGPMRYALFDAKGSVFITMAIELILLFAVFGVAWMLVLKLRDLGVSKRDDPHFTSHREEIGQKLIATGIQAVATLAMMSILCRTDQKCSARVDWRSIDGRLDRRGHGCTDAPSVWYWPGPLLVGLLGYLWSSMNTGLLSLGQPAGYFAALCARCLLITRVPASPARCSVTGLAARGRARARANRQKNGNRRPRRKQR